MSNSPTEYIEELRATIRQLRAELLRARNERNEAITRMLVERRHNGRAPHDYEPARPGLGDVD